MLVAANVYEIIVPGVSSTSKSNVIDLLPRVPRTARTMRSCQVRIADLFAPQILNRPREVDVFKAVHVVALDGNAFHLNIVSGLKEVFLI